jgi:NitT/TauT family transport system permease protein
LKQNPMDKRLMLLARFGILLAVLAAWEGAARHFPAVQFALARPTLVGNALADLLRGWMILPHVAATGGAAVLGLVLGTVLGAGLGLLTWFSRSTAQVLRPFVVALGAMPILTVAPMMIIWFGIGLEMKVALATLSTVFVAFAQSAQGAEKVSNEYVEVLQGMNATPAQVFIKVVVPGSLDWVFSSMRLNAGLALLGAFIGEFIASNRGLGYLVLRASSLYDVPRAIAAAFFIVMLALIFDWTGTQIEKRRNILIRWFCISTCIR